MAAETVTWSNHTVYGMVIHREMLMQCRELTSITGGANYLCSFFHYSYECV
jgi:hypothetical protein